MMMIHAPLACLFEKAQLDTEYLFAHHITFGGKNIQESLLPDSSPSPATCLLFAILVIFGFFIISQD